MLIPECGTPEVLAETLSALECALQLVDEPTHVRIVVNGAPADAYADLVRLYPRHDWRFVESALGFHGAVALGLRGLPHDWVYLLNSDMRLSPRALAAVLPWRENDVFAIASSIDLADSTQRREETGLTGWSDGESLPALHDIEFEASSECFGEACAPLSHLYAGGGASLFRVGPLRAAVAESRCYAPFYFEDTDWGLRAWRCGWRVLFCGGSKAIHRRRATIGRLAPAEVERVLMRNRWWLEARHALLGLDASALLEQMWRLPPQSQREVASLVAMPSLWRSRLRARQVGAQTELAAGMVTMPARLRGPSRGPRPRMLWVTPFALLPTSHGSARRSIELLRALSSRYEIVLISDEADRYPIDAWRQLDFCYAIRLVGGRPAEDPSIASPRRRRRATHAHPLLCHAVRQALAHFQPDLVHIEHAEAMDLIELRDRARWLITLHDAPFGQGIDDDEDERTLLRRYDAAIACSREDLSLIEHRRAWLIENGSAVDPNEYTLSPAQGPVLFVGAFRHVQNWDGLCCFLAQVWPQVLHAQPSAQLQIVGGEGAPAAAAQEPLFAQQGIAVMERVDDLAALYRGASVCINPQQAIRGSALKVIEALCAGRIMVSTTDGVRGFSDVESRALHRVEHYDQMAAAIVHWLEHVEARHEAERPRPELLGPHRWSSIAAHKHALLSTLLEGVVA